MKHGWLVGLLVFGVWANVEAGTASYTYDALGRVTTVVNSGGINAGYQYDPLGNFSTRTIAPPPSAPPSITGISIGAGTVTFTFAPPGTYTGATITGYVVNCSPGALSTSAPADATAVTQSGLSKGTTYTCTLAANSVVGLGAPSPVQTIVGGSQTIAFGLVNSLLVGINATIPVSASSGLAVTLTSTTPSVCSVVSGSTISGLVAGTCTLNATQPGNGNFLAATPITITLQVISPGALIILFGDD